MDDLRAIGEEFVIVFEPSMQDSNAQWNIITYRVIGYLPAQEGRWIPELGRYIPAAPKREEVRAVEIRTEPAQFFMADDGTLKVAPRVES